MHWIKNALIDIAITVMIVLAVTLDLAWARWIVLIYTPLMLILKIVALLGSQAIGQLKRKDDDVPGWFYHVLYAVNVIVPVLDGWWLVAGGWALIWLLSLATDVRKRRSTGA